MKSLVNKAVSYYLRFRKQKIHNLRFNASGRQQKIFQDFLHSVKNTQFGKDHFINEVSDLHSFKEAIPVNHYEDLEPYILDTMMGNQYLLSPEKIKWFAKSSGTTNNRSKYIPVSKKYLFNNHIKGNWDAVGFIYEQMPDIRIFERKNLLMGGTIHPYTKNPSVYVGDITGIMIKHIPPIGRPFYTPDFNTALIKDWDEKIEKMAPILINEDVTLAAGVPTWSTILFNKMLEISKKNNMLEVWPNAKIYVHGGVNFDPYQKQFSDFFPSPDFQFLQGYNASEGYIALQDVFGTDDMLLLCDNENFFEFIELTDYHNNNYHTKQLDDVSINTDYVLIMSNTSGLWRYVIGDTIQFTNLNPYRIQITGRTKQFINAFGEELMVHNAEKAIGIISKRYQLQIKEYTVAPFYISNTEKGRHDWYIEFLNPPKDLKRMSIELDAELQKLNSDYSAKRQKDLALTCLKIHTLPNGTFEKWYRSKNRFGSQNKVPRLSNNRLIADELVRLKK